MSHSLRRIVVGFDDGAGARDALAAAIELARPTRAHLHLVSVVPEMSKAWWVDGGATVDAATIERWIEQRRSQLADTAREALDDAAGIETSAEVLSGGAIPELLAASADADLLVLGSRRWARLSHLVLGSVAEAVVRSSTCPTLVVPRRSADRIDHDRRFAASTQS